VSERMPHNEFNDAEIMNTPELVASLISEGFNIGDGPISGQEIDSETRQALHETITTEPEIIVPVDVDETGAQIDDDGCGDGRSVKLITRMGKVLKRSLNRAKVFGGAVAMTGASRIGLGLAHDRNLIAVFKDSIDALNEEGIDYGAHTDVHAHGENCGCGAIDKAPEALLASLKYETQIRHLIADLGVPTEGLDTVYDHYRKYVTDTLARDPQYSGRAVMDMITEAGKVVKQLDGDHKERAIVLNTVRGYTVNQALIRAKTDGKAQAFAVDVWRLDDIVSKLYSADTEAQQMALQSELVYTLAISAVLTKGDLPVYTIQAQSAPVAA
jgi:hypothetical protein